MLEARRLDMVEPPFGLQAAGRLLTDVFAPWVQDLGMLVEAVEAGRPPGAPADWQPGAVLRLPRLRSEEEWALGLLARDVVVHPGHFYEFAGEGYLVLSLIPEPDLFGAGLARIEEFAVEA